MVNFVDENVLKLLHENWSGEQEHHLCNKLKRASFFDIWPKDKSVKHLGWGLRLSKQSPQDQTFPSLRFQWKFMRRRPLIDSDSDRKHEKAAPIRRTSRAQLFLGSERNVPRNDNDEDWDLTDTWSPIGIWRASLITIVQQMPTVGTNTESGESRPSKWDNDNSMINLCWCCWLVKLKQFSGEISRSKCIISAKLDYHAAIKMWLCVCQW